MKRSQKISKKIISVSTVASTFIGMMAAVPFGLALGSPANQASATELGQSSMAQVTTADFAKFAYAFNQGYDAHVASASSTSGGSATSCSEVSVATPAGSGGVVASASSVKTASAPVWHAPRGAGGAGAGGGEHRPDVASSHRMASMVNSYNTYTSMVYNSSSVENTNSNNNVGSNNSTKTELKLEIEDSKGVMVGANVSNNPSATQIATDDSFNKTDTTIVNDSFNKDVEVNKTDIDVDDSFNAESETKVEDSNNTTTVTNEVEITKEVDVNNGVQDSFNDNEIEADEDLTIEDNEVEGQEA